MNSFIRTLAEGQNHLEVLHVVDDIAAGHCCNHPHHQDCNTSHYFHLKRRQQQEENTQPDSEDLPLDLLRGERRWDSAIPEPNRGRSKAHARDLLTCPTRCLSPTRKKSGEKKPPASSTTSEDQIGLRWKQQQLCPTNTGYDNRDFIGLLLEENSLTGNKQVLDTGKCPSFLSAKGILREAYNVISDFDSPNSLLLLSPAC